jgi:hypothetical protein
VVDRDIKDGAHDRLLSGFVRSTQPFAIVIGKAVGNAAFPCEFRVVVVIRVSRFFVKSPELAGIRARILSLQAVDWISGVVLGPLSLPCKIAFPHGRGLSLQSADWIAGTVSGSLSLPWKIAFPGGLHSISVGAHLGPSSYL